MAQDYDRYRIFRNEDGTTDQLPFVVIKKSSSDKYVDWKLGVSRMDRLAAKYYSNDFFDFLILYANPKYISEFDIPDGEVIRIPFPLDDAKRRYESELKKIRDR